MPSSALGPAFRNMADIMKNTAEEIAKEVEKLRRKIRKRLPDKMRDRFDRDWDKAEDSKGHRRATAITLGKVTDDIVDMGADINVDFAGAESELWALIDLLRAKSVREALHDPLDDDLEVFAASATEASDARRDLRGLLATLPERQRLPIVHVKLQGLSIAEAAQLTGMSESAVKVGIHRGLKALAAKIKGAP